MGLIIDRKFRALPLVDNCDGGVPYQATEVAIGRDDNALVVRFDCRETAPVSKGKQYNDPLWEGDIVELLITTDASDRYLEIEINPDGIGYAVLIDNRDGEGDIAIEPLAVPPFTAEAACCDGGWTTTFKVPFDRLKQLGWDPERCRLNLYRQDFDRQGNLHLSALSPTMSATFHKPRAFVPVIIKE